MVELAILLVVAAVITVVGAGILIIRKEKPDRASWITAIGATGCVAFAITISGKVLTEPEPVAIQPLVEGSGPVPQGWLDLGKRLSALTDQINALVQDDIKPTSKEVRELIEAARKQGYLRVETKIYLPPERRAPQPTPPNPQPTPPSPTPTPPNPQPTPQPDNGEVVW